MLDSPFYHGTTKKIIVAFGQLFSNIKIERRNTTGIVEQLIDVPVSYGNREKWYQRLKEEADTDKRVLITLPRIGFELSGMGYDTTRKLNKFTQYRACTPTVNGNYLSAYVPVPYNLSFNVYIITKTQDDMFQIVEQILPYFAPQYNLSINAFPELEIVQEVPVNLDGVQLADSYEGPMEVRREIISTLTFTIKTEFLGKPKDDSNTIIKKVITKIDADTDIAREVDVTATGEADNYTIDTDMFWIDRPLRTNNVEVPDYHVFTKPLTADNTLVFADNSFISADATIYAP